MFITFLIVFGHPGEPLMDSALNSEMHILSYY